MITIQVACEIDAPRPVSEIATQLLLDVFNSEGFETVECTLIFTGDDYLSDLKKQFFQVDQFTDVIAFRLNDYAEQSVEGEIYISLPRAQENAGIYNEPFAKEVARLIIHGGLHLLGFNDKTDLEQQAMRKKEEEYLIRFDWNELFVESEMK